MPPSDFLLSSFVALLVILTNSVEARSVHTACAEFRSAQTRTSQSNNETETMDRFSTDILTRMEARQKQEKNKIYRQILLRLRLLCQFRRFSISRRTIKFERNVYVRITAHCEKHFDQLDCRALERSATRLPQERLSMLRGPTHEFTN